MINIKKIFRIFKNILLVVPSLSIGGFLTSCNVSELFEKKEIPNWDNNFNNFKKNTENNTTNKPKEDVNKKQDNNLENDFVIEYKQVTPEQNEIDKHRAIQNIRLIVGDKNIESYDRVFDKTRNQKIYFAIKEKLNSARNELLRITPLVYDEMGLREGRFRSNLIRYENFINNFLKTKKIGSNPNNFIISNMINYFHNDIYSYKWNCVNNYEFINTFLDDVLNYLKGVQRDIALTFDKENALVIDNEYLENLNFLNKNLDSEYMSPKDIKNFRKQLLKNGTAKIENIKVNKPVVNSPDHTTIYDIVYDLTGGSNYFNDIVSFSYSYKPISNNQYIYSMTDNLDYRTENVEEQIIVNKMILAVIPNIISKNMSDAQKIEAVHNWIADRTEYSSNTELKDKSLQDKIRSTFRFVNKESVVCEGYARMFSKFMLFLNIDCWYITGYATNGADNTELHAWNMVNLDGQDLFIDVTWDDPIMPITNRNDFIQHKSITAYKRDYLLKDWNTFSNNGRNRRIDDLFYKLKKYREERKKEYINLLYFQY
ncbi:transglutaminase domain-containing protein [Mycoplasma elephantis]|uniref:transglutaminase domain-containing protein n=1 Tax=Mycoplasma elephantis TaxID=114882 RepID=UPI00047F10FA|nr:transglutaminase domain-containing protein [Mycoplasma elephantis]